MLTAFKIRNLFSLFMRGIFLSISLWQSKPVARIRKMYKSYTRFFVDNREISKFAVKGVPFLPFFVDSYEGTIFSEHGGEPNDMKSPQGQKTRNSRYPYTGLKKTLLQAQKVSGYFQNFCGCPHKNCQ